MRILAKTGRRYFLSHDKEDEERKDDGDTSFSPFFFSSCSSCSSLVSRFSFSREFLAKKESTHVKKKKNEKQTTHRR